jgi:hypothetical protein
VGGEQVSFQTVDDGVTVLRGAARAIARDLPSGKLVGDARAHAVRPGLIRAPPESLQATPR